VNTVLDSCFHNTEKKGTTAKNFNLHLHLHKVTSSCTQRTQTANKILMGNKNIQLFPVNYIIIYDS
jgi:hypothetical protein